MKKLTFKEVIPIFSRKDHPCLQPKRSSMISAEEVIHVFSWKDHPCLQLKTSSISTAEDIIHVFRWINWLLKKLSNVFSHTYSWKGQRRASSAEEFGLKEVFHMFINRSSMSSADEFDLERSYLSIQPKDFIFLALNKLKTPVLLLRLYIDESL